MAEAPLVGGIELGGTKTVLAVGRSDGAILARATIPTRDPQAVMADAIGFFRDAGQGMTAIGVGAFGPIVLDPASADHGRLLQTNKPGWSGFDLAGALHDGLGLPVRLVTDVGAAALGEAHLGALRGLAIGLYLTVGTGIGGATVCNGALPPALLHPEMGHLALRRQADDLAPSTCQFHADCAEGLASGPAIMARFGQTLSHFAPGGPEHRLVAGYLGQLCASLVLTLSPQRIVLGGGVGQTPGLLPEIQQAMLAQLGGYGPAALEAEGYIASPVLDQDAGIHGALICAAGADAPAGRAWAA